jgi:hypothetical protein
MPALSGIRISAVFDHKIYLEASLPSSMTMDWLLPGS